MKGVSKSVIFGFWGEASAAMAEDASSARNDGLMISA
jgi:hypothetical protein